MSHIVNCFKCKKAIQEQPLIALGRFWHKGCFTCTKCRQFLDTESAILQEGYLYHPQCLPVIDSLHFNRRNKSIPLPIWMIEKPSHSSKHIYHPILNDYICAICQKPIGLQYFVYHELRYYHSSCFIGKNIPICDICRKPINGQAIIDNWGSIFCANHAEPRNNTCSECGRLICQQLTHGSVHYPDNRNVCNICQRTAIKTDEQVNSKIKWIREVFGKNGLLIDERLFPVLLVDRGIMNQLTKNNNGVVGLFCPSPQINNRRSIEAICCLWGQPDYAFSGTLAHELGHAWFYINHVDNLDRNIEEGLCNVLKYLLLSENKNPETLFSVQSLFRNNDPVYGGGFRMAEEMLHKYSIGALMRFVSQHGTLP